MSPEIESLSQAVEQKKEAVTSQQSELEQLEARIRETEARLQAKAEVVDTPEGQSNSGSLHREKSTKRGGLDGLFAPPPAEPENPSSSARRSQTGHARKQSTSSGAKRK